ncbi:hypothetical protein Y032_0018g3596 [Ancylostoma ceylanicum]|uniref:Uncharacterized protein n=1 Tax=Ancylostoma ceylanicum TaxID=53326 RepID=A0A016V4F3_9BILA|nr:hypothetical protein Y032_0018g3596 [Ancylostoma ceylanicum]
MLKWSALVNPVMWDALRMQIHLRIVEAFNAYVPYTVTCEGHPMNQVSLPRVLWYQFTDYGGMACLVGRGRDRTIDRVRAQRASYHCNARAVRDTYSFNLCDDNRSNL